MTFTWFLHDFIKILKTIYLKGWHLLLCTVWSVWKIHSIHILLLTLSFDPLKIFTSYKSYRFHFPSN